MFINISNHPIERWSEKQRLAAAAFYNGGIYHRMIDVPHPPIPPDAAEWEVVQTAKKTFKEVAALFEGTREDEEKIVHLMGELSYEEMHMVMCFFVLAYGMAGRKTLDEEGGIFFFKLLEGFRRSAKIKGSLAAEMKEALRLKEPEVFNLVNTSDTFSHPSLN